MEMVSIVKLWWARLTGKKIFLLSEDELLFKKQLREVKLLRSEINGHEFCIIEKNGIIVAFENICPHRGLPLHNGFVEDDCWVCPFHRHYFSLAGSKNPKGHEGHLKFGDVRVIGRKVYFWG
jgi:nitrite reductase/ring-hydroxylating ferredoxin subunit